MRAVLVFLVLAACHGSTPRAPANVPDLPPSSGTVIGVLVDEAQTLRLRPDQLDKLRELDGSLVAANARTDAGLRGKHLKHHQPTGPDPDVVQTLADQHTANNRIAVERALSLLDSDQVPPARQLLAQRGYAAPEAKPAAPPPELVGVPQPTGDGGD
jgi:hypothetical protein